MKKLLLLFFVGLFSLSFTAKVDSDGVIKALKAANAEQLATFFDSFIDLKLPEKDEVKNMGKNQAGIALKAFFADTSRIKPTAHHPKNKVSINRICGPVKKIDDTTFQISFYRMGFNNPKRSNDIWLLASNNGNGHYKSAVQQINMRFPIVNKEIGRAHV